jgi:pimeloyl-ACP methyl ester carboxylesterase
LKDNEIKRVLRRQCPTGIWHVKKLRHKIMKAHAHRWMVVAAIISVGAGAALSHVIEPGVRVEKMMLATNTPALRIFPATPGPHPIALLAHGNGGSKEMMFRFGEALAAAGFECYSVDLAGYGESPLPCSLTNLDLNFQETCRALGAVDVFIGHSLGGGVGGWSVCEAGFRPKLFIGVGAPVELGEHGPPLLLLGGLFEEFFRPAQLRARTDAQVVISPWCEHVLEAYDPVLVRAAVKAACAAVGKPVPAAPTAWRWRFAGLLLGIAGARGLMLYLPELHPRLARTRRFIVPAVLLIAVSLTWWPWIGMAPQLRRIPQQLVLLVVIWLALAGLGRLRMPRWSLPAITGILALVCLAVAFSTPSVLKTLGLAQPQIFLFATLTCALGISALLLVPSTLVGRIAARGGPRRDGDIAMAVFASYVIGQFMPLFY